MLPLTLLLACAQIPPDVTPMTACLWTHAPVEETAVKEWQVELNGTLVEAGQVEELEQWELPTDDIDNFGAWCLYRDYSHGVVVDAPDGQRWWLGLDASETGLDTSSPLPGSEVEVDYHHVRQTVAGNIIQVLVATEQGPLFGGTDDLSFDSPVPGLSVTLGQAGEQRYRSSCLTWVDVGLVFQGDSRVEVQPQSGALIHPRSGKMIRGRRWRRAPPLGVRTKECASISRAKNDTEACDRKPHAWSVCLIEGVQVDGVSFQAFVPVSRQVESVRCTETHLRRNQWFVARTGG